MKYMLLMQFSGQPQGELPPIDTWPVEDVQAHIQFMHDTNQKLVDAGEFVDARGLAAPDQAKIVRAGEGGAAASRTACSPRRRSSSPATGSSTCESPERAYEIAAHVSAAPGPGGRPLNMPIEVRQVMSGRPVRGAVTAG